MAAWLDFSGRPPGAAAIKARGYAGVLRYIGLGNEGKQIHRAEYEDYIRNGLGVLLVAELGTGDAWDALDDYATGRARAMIALEDARREGVPDSVGIACAADAHASSAAQIRDAVQYAAGFASVLGWERTGFYGFSETSQAVHAAGVVGWHWRCGSEPSSEDKKWVNFWQRNRPPSTVVINGTTCDINEAFAPLQGDDMPLTQADLNFFWDGTILDGKTPRQRLEQVEGYGERVTHTEAMVTELAKQVTEVRDAIAKIQVGGVDVAALAKALADEQDRRARDGDPTTGPTT
jgi:uncharacterized coiled-coil protein SlyX